MFIHVLVCGSMTWFYYDSLCLHWRSLSWCGGMWALGSIGGYNCVCVHCGVWIPVLVCGSLTWFYYDSVCVHCGSIGAGGMWALGSIVSRETCRGQTCSSLDFPPSSHTLHHINHIGFPFFSQKNCPLSIFSISIIFLHGFSDLFSITYFVQHKSHLISQDFQLHQKTVDSDSLHNMIPLDFWHFVLPLQRADLKR